MLGVRNEEENDNKKLNQDEPLALSPPVRQAGVSGLDAIAGVMVWPALSVNSVMEPRGRFSKQYATYPY